MVAKLFAAFFLGVATADDVAMKYKYMAKGEKEHRDREFHALEGKLNSILLERRPPTKKIGEAARRVWAEHHEQLKLFGVVQASMWSGAVARGFLGQSQEKASVPKAEVEPEAATSNTDQTEEHVSEAASSTTQPIVVIGVGEHRWLHLITKALPVSMIAGLVAAFVGFAFFQRAGHRAARPPRSVPPPRLSQEKTTVPSSARSVGSRTSSGTVWVALTPRVVLGDNTATYVSTPRTHLFSDECCGQVSTPRLIEPKPDAAG